MTRHRSYSQLKRSSVIGIAALASFLLLMAGIATTRGAARSGDLSGLSSISGSVTSPKAFKAAKVYFRNSEKHRLYMVYTNGGKYQAMHLEPGTYDLTVEAPGLESPAQKVNVKAGSNPNTDVTLHAATAKDSNVQLVPYDQLYPAGEGRKIAERLCIRCHGPNFLPGKQWSAEQWNSAIDFMSGNGPQRGANTARGTSAAPNEKHS